MQKREIMDGESPVAGVITPVPAGGTELSRRLALISSVSAYLGNGASLRYMAPGILADVCGVLEADACVLRELRGTDLCLVASTGIPDGQILQSIPADVGLACKLIGNREPVSVVHAPVDPITASLHQQGTKDSSRPHFTFLAYAGAPMFADGQVVGVLGIYMTNVLRVFAQEDLDLLQILANVIGRALENERFVTRFNTAIPKTRLRIAHLLEGLPTQSSDPETELEYELRKSTKDLVVHYQPIIPCRPGLPKGFEALARWNHPKRGLLGPDEFIPMAERTGLIAQVGQGVARHAMSLLADQFPTDETFVTLNVSLVQLEDDHFTAMFMALLSWANIPPSRIALEITENVILERSSRAARIIGALAEQGFPIFIDDFGAGFSSLSHLVYLPVAGIKVDKLFLCQSLDDTRRRKVLKAMISMAHDLGLLSVIEGIETPWQHEAVLELAPDYMQGFALGRPGMVG